MRVARRKTALLNAGKIDFTKHESEPGDYFMSTDKPEIPQM